MSPLTAQMVSGPILSLPLLHEGLKLPDWGRDVGRLLRPLLPEVLLQTPDSQESVHHGLCRIRRLKQDEVLIGSDCMTLILMLLVLSECFLSALSSL